MRSAPRLAPLILLLAAVLCGAAAMARSESPQVVRARKLMELVESPPEGMSPDSLIQAMESSEVELLAYLQSSPRDTEAATLVLRFHDARSTVLAYVRLLSGKDDPAEDNDAYASVVDRALEADTLHAELHYWKSRLLSVPKLSGGRLVEAPKVHEALREARRAVALDSTERGYRENLAFLLIMSGDDVGAMAIYRKMDPNHFLYLQLQDWTRLPEIEGTVPIVDSTRYLFPINSPLASLAVAGTRSYLFAGTAMEFEASCRKHWRSFRLIPDPDPGRYPPGTNRYAQHLRWNGDKLEPFADEADVVGGTQPGVGVGGIWVEVRETRSLPTDPPDLHPGVKAGEVYCHVEFQNKRGP